MLTTTQQTERAVEVACRPKPAPPSVTAAAMRDIRTMHLLDRIAAGFNEAGIELMTLGGAALNLALDLEPGARPIRQLDVMVRDRDIRAATTLLADLGCVPDDDLPGGFTAGAIAPVKITLHTQPFVLRRSARRVSPDAMWRRSCTVTLGDTTLRVLSPEDTLAYLAVRSAVVGNCRIERLRDIKQWIRGNASSIDWASFLAGVESWRLAVPIRSALTATTITLGEICPPEVHRRLAAMPARRLDRLALRRAVKRNSDP